MGGFSKFLYGKKLGGGDFLGTFVPITLLSHFMTTSYMACSGTKRKHSIISKRDVVFSIKCIYEAVR